MVEKIDARECEVLLPLNTHSDSAGALNYEGTGY
jgi:hypothetical protein